MSLALTLGIAVLALGRGQGSYSAAFEAARRALDEGRRGAAVEHGLAALELRPGSRETLALLLEAAGEDPAARALWSHDLAAACADAKGSLKLAKPLSALVSAKDGSVSALAQARAAAALELAEFARKSRRAAERQGDAVVLAGWAAELGRELVHAAPELLALHAEDFPAGFPTSRAAQRATLDALARRLSAAAAAGDEGPAVEIALILRGLGAQAGFEDLAGPEPPDMSKELRAAGEALARARERLARSQPEPRSVAELEQMDGDERDRFTRDHASFASPGVALSPVGRYRVETICGHATLLGAAATVEFHHARLAEWFGVDPFVDRAGVVRVVPESAGLESEGAPFWWVGGFQGGDVTTLRLSCGTIEGLGRGLTHELTHRFDGAVFPGLPAWLTEGRAVWTAAAYANIADRQFVANHALFGTIDDARFRGYGGRDKLEQLVRGTIDDYRDNYVAGYALYVFLHAAGEAGEPPRYAGALDAFLRSRKSDRRDALAAFEAHFCDGEDGRASDFEAFVEEFGRWIAGFYWRDRKPWTERFVESPGPTEASEYVLDEPTWVWSRKRAEPWFGQDQARAAGALLQRLGDEPGARDAFLWSLAVDERWDSTDAALQRLFGASAKREEQWYFAHALERRGFASAGSAGASPSLARLPKTRALLATYRSTVEDYLQRDWRQAAAGLAADHDRLASIVGTETLAAGVGAVDVGAAHLHPFDEPARSLLPSGWVEDQLTDYERHRVKGLWCTDEREQLFVGRREPRSGTGSADRGAALHHVFVRSPLWLEPGRYRVRARIAPTSSYVAGAIVVGDERRDRNVRFSFSAGDYAYSIGDKDEPAELASVGWNLQGLFERDAALPGAQRGGKHSFDHTVSAFELELAIDVGAVHAFVDGEHVATYHAASGMPVQGFVGFALSSGDYKVTAVRVQRLDRSAAFAPLDGVPAALRLDQPRSAPFGELLNRRVFGLPLHAQGTLCLWLPDDAPGSGAARDVERAVGRLRDLEIVVTRQSISTPLVVARPAVWGRDAAQRVGTALAGEISEDFQQRLTTVAHGPATAEAWAAARERYDLPDRHQTWILFVDSAGVLRAAETFHAGKRLDGAFLRWIEVFRNR